MKEEKEVRKVRGGEREERTRLMMMNTEEQIINADSQAEVTGLSGGGCLRTSSSGVE